MWVHAWVYVYFPYGCSRSPLNKTVVPLLSKPTSFVSNEHLPGSLPTTAGFSVSPCQQPMTLIRCFITPKRCVCGREKVRKLVRECGLVCATQIKPVCLAEEKCVLEGRGSVVCVCSSDKAIMRQRPDEDISCSSQRVCWVKSRAPQPRDAVCVGWPISPEKNITSADDDSNKDGLKHWWRFACLLAV